MPLAKDLNQLIFSLAFHIVLGVIVDRKEFDSRLEKFNLSTDSIVWGE